MQTVTTPETESYELIMEAVETLKQLKAELDEDSCHRKELYEQSIVGLNMDDAEALVVNDKNIAKKRKMRYADDLEQVRCKLILKLQKLPENQSGRVKEVLSIYNEEYKENLADRSREIARIEEQCAVSKDNKIKSTHAMNHGLFKSACDTILEEIERTT